MPAFPLPVQSPCRSFLGHRAVVVAAYESHGNPSLSQACEPGLEAGLAGASGAERAVEKVPQHYEPFAPMGL